MSTPAWAIGAKTGPVRSYKDLKVFACEGLICIIDERPGNKEGEFTVVLPDELNERVAAVNRPYRGKGRIEMTRWQKQEYDQQIQGSQNCKECIKEAKAMGDPSDPQVREFWSKHRRSSTVRVKFSPGADLAGYPALPDVPRGNITGRTTEPAVPLIHTPPKKKNRSGLLILD